MTCKILTNDDNEPIAIACGSPWGIGTVVYHDDEGDEVVYGFAGSGTDPHDFTPDEESCTEKEIAAWKEAKKNCKCSENYEQRTQETTK